MDADVIVAGAGPAGLMLGYELGLAGIRTVILERLPHRTGQSKALNLQPRSAEILELRGLLEPLQDRVLDRIPAGHFAGIPLDYTLLDTRHPYQLGIPQARIEEFLEDRLADLGVPVLRGRTVTGLEQDTEGVTVTTEGVGATTEGVTVTTGGARLRAAYLVGCDGGRSTVRHLLGTPFTGRDARMTAVVADVLLADEAGALPGQWAVPSLTPRDGMVVTVIPLGDGVYRMLFAGPEQQLLDRNAPITEGEVRRALHHGYGDRPRLRRIKWASRFTDASRQAQSYRNGRVLLAGDAAHIHSPTGGQGLNLGLQDAFNLGWKLAAQLHGHAPDGLLETYHRERHPVAARVLASTRAQGVLMFPDEDVAALRSVVSDLLTLPDAGRHLAEMISGLDIRYDMPDGTPHPLLGSRAPDLDLETSDGPTRLSRLLHRGRPVHLAFGAAAAPHPRVEQVTAKPVQSLGTDGLLIRPDGYICDTGASPQAALTRWFGKIR
jgi:2-polyprenyl-6-methoxyphenol hydroxylase-like FAD-dependent oxidoreductase